MVAEASAAAFARQRRAGRHDAEAAARGWMGALESLAWQSLRRKAAGVAGSRKVAPEPAELKPDPLVRSAPRTRARRAALWLKPKPEQSSVVPLLHSPLRSQCCAAAVCTAATVPRPGVQGLGPAAVELHGGAGGGPGQAGSDGGDFGFWGGVLCGWSGGGGDPFSGICVHSCAWRGEGGQPFPCPAQVHGLLDAVIHNGKAGVVSGCDQAKQAYVVSGLERTRNSRCATLNVLTGVRRRVFRSLSRTENVSHCGWPT